MDNKICDVQDLGFESTWTEQAIEDTKNMAVAVLGVEPNVIGESV